MKEANDHSRVTPAGRLAGFQTARLIEPAVADLVRQGEPDERCKSCAGTYGTVPNGCLQTQLDFLKSAAEAKPFLCHSPLNGQLCAGWVRARAELAARPLPPQAMALIAKWEYSPPDEPASDAVGSTNPPNTVRQASPSGDGE